ncbi:MAG: sulfatase [Candidatus Caenarcaniphilales bacterium]|nr:sulfatase [Candidatus Caenarcaniphilales bacterium]
MFTNLNRREFIKNIGLISSLITISGSSLSCSKESEKIISQYQSNLIDRKNIQNLNFLFIVIDDLNDFCSPYNGYPGAHTPNIAKLASESTVFNNAFCSVPVCGASRASILSGLDPNTTKLYRQNLLIEEFKSNQKYFDRKKIELKTIPRQMKELGYKTYGAGKIYHNAGYEKKPGKGLGNYEKEIWDDFLTMDYSTMHPDGYDLDFPNRRNLIGNRFGEKYSDCESAMPDSLTTDWCVNKLQMNHNSPFFLFAGIHKPHLSWYVPKRFYDLYPLDSIKTPNLDEELNDLNDIPNLAVKEFKLNGADQKDLVKRNLIAGAIRAYLANISFADECVGNIINALNQSQYKDNTVICLLSDHGWFLGEKLGWRKFKLWEKATRVPMMIKHPKLTNGQFCNSIVSTLDIFPTILDILGVENQSNLDGISFKDLIYTPNLGSNRFAVSNWKMHKGKSIARSIRTNSWRYIKYNDRNEELYRHNFVDARKERTNLLHVSNLTSEYRNIADKLNNQLNNYLSSLR